MKKWESDDEEGLLNRKAASTSSSLHIDEDEERSSAYGEYFSPWPHVFNLANCIIGVSVLAMPYVFQQCGILLAAMMIAFCAVITKLTCHFLSSSAFAMRCDSYEAVAQTSLGLKGRRIAEMCLLCFLVSSIVAFIVVIGDIGPHIVAEYLELEAPTQRLRILVMVLVVLFIVLPLSMIEDLSKFSVISSLAVLFYTVFVARMILESLPTLYNGEWSINVIWWRSEGLLTSVPIVCMAMCCQTQLFPVVMCIKKPSVERVDHVVSLAVNVCAALYAAVGVFGYVAFYSKHLHGDVLVQLSPTLFTQLLKLFFLLSVAVSIPMMLFPARTALFYLFFKPSGSDVPTANLERSTFHILTGFILIINLILAILVPNVEFILGLTGAFIGTIVSTILPSIMFIYIQKLNVTNRLKTNSTKLAKICLVVGITILVASTWAVLASERTVHVAEKPMPKDTVNEKPVLETLEKLEEKVLNANLNISQKLDDISNLAAKGKDSEAVKILVEMKEQQKVQQELLEKQEQIVAQLNRDISPGNSSELI